MTWWTCPLCFDRMVTQVDPRNVERDRDAHLSHSHADAMIAAPLLIISSWTTIGERDLVPARR